MILNELKDFYNNDVYDRACKRVAADNILGTKSPSVMGNTLISSAFVWDQTPEGGDYWLAISEGHSIIYCESLRRDIIGGGTFEPKINIKTRYSNTNLILLAL